MCCKHLSSGAVVHKSLQVRLGIDKSMQKENVDEKLLHGKLEQNQRSKKCSKAEVKASASKSCTFTCHIVAHETEL